MENIKFTKRETEVICLYRAGYRNSKIGPLLGIDQKTVSTYLLRIKRKLNLLNDANIYAVVKTAIPYLVIGEEFENAKILAKMHPKTFFRPNDKELNALSVDDQVKICNGEERFWTTIAATDTDGFICAFVNNTLVGSTDLKLGSVVFFTVDNVYDIW